MRLACGPSRCPGSDDASLWPTSPSLETEMKSFLAGKKNRQTWQPPGTSHALSTGGTNGLGMVWSAHVRK